LANDEKQATELFFWAFLVSVGALGLLDQLGVWLPSASISSIVGIPEDDMTLILLVLTLFSIIGLYTLSRDEEYHPHSIAWKNRESNPDQEPQKSEESEPEAEANWWQEKTE